MLADNALLSERLWWVKLLGVWCHRIAELLYCGCGVRLLVVDADCPSHCALKSRCNGDWCRGWMMGLVPAVLGCGVSPAPRASPAAPCPCSLHSPQPACQPPALPPLPTNDPPEHFLAFCLILDSRGTGPSCYLQSIFTDFFNCFHLFKPLLVKGTFLVSYLWKWTLLRSYYSISVLLILLLVGSSCSYF